MQGLFAVFEVMFELIVHLFTAVLAIASAIVEFVITVLFHGISAAVKQRRQALSQSKEQNLAGSRLSPQLSKKEILQGGLLLAVAGAVIGVIGINEYAQRQRTLATRLQVEALLLAEANNVKANNPEGQVNRLLPDKDAWEQPIQLIIDDWIVGNFVVVRSVGRDGHKGTYDDVLDFDFVQIRLKKAAKKLAGLAGKPLLDRAAKLLPNIPRDRIAKKLGIVDDGPKP
jgi:hypothetical protein